MSDSNAIQIGGDHYKGVALQHWDWVGTNGLTYLEGCATKYVVRHKKKNGVEDLQKSIHYVRKMREDYDSNTVTVRPIRPIFAISDGVVRMGVPASSLEYAAIMHIITGQYAQAEACINNIIAGVVAS